MDEKWLEDLRRRLAQLPRSESGRCRYSASLREEILTMDAVWQETGQTRSELARQLGMKEATLANWVRRDVEKERAEEEADRAALEAERERVAAMNAMFVKEIELVDDAEDASTSSIAIVLPGARIEGLSVADVVEVLRRLG